MPSKPLFVANARTALGLGMRQLGLKSGDGILIPGFICDVVLHPIIKLGLNPVFYRLEEDLSPNWNDLELTAAATTCRAIVMVHYFGQPQSVEHFRRFCLQHRLWLIEDNAHGYGGRVEEEHLGSIGDIGISSPRKLLGTPSGGVLHGADSSSELAVREMRRFPLFSPTPALKLMLSLCKPLRRRLRSLLDRSKDWSNPRLFREEPKAELSIDRLSRRRIISANWREIAKRRREYWVAWSHFADKQCLKPVFWKVHCDSCPTALPVYGESIVERNRWLKWGVDNNIALYPWPALPEEVILRGGEELARWNRLICFPLDVAPPMIAERSGA